MEIGMLDESGGLYMDSVNHSVQDPFSECIRPFATVINAKGVSKRVMQISESTELPMYIQRGYAKIAFVASANKYATIIVDQTKEIFCDIYHITNGKACKVDHLVASSFYFAFKINDLSRTIEEICRATGVDTKDMSVTNRRFLNELKSKQYYHKMANVMDPKDLILRFKDNLTTTNEHKVKIAKATRDIMDKIAASTVLEGKTPNTICATSMWLAVTNAFKDAVKPVTKEEVAAACHIKLITLNKSLKIVSHHRVIS
jgi:transcription initiation factor TFIIIB Brf1 subunit/transcription initiation factor TFIIB